MLKFSKIVVAVSGLAVGVAVREFCCGYPPPPTESQNIDER
jgi:hypothetical protein